MGTKNIPHLEAWLEQLVAHSPVVLYCLPLRGDRTQLSWISANVSARFGYAPDDCLAPRWWHDRIHPDDRAVLGQWAALRFSERVVCEYRFRMADDSYRWIRDDMQRIPDADDEPPMCVGTLSDINERKHAELALELSEAQYRAVVEESVQGIVVQQAGRIRYANHACLRIFGYRNLDEVAGQPWDDFVLPEDVPLLRSRIDACTRGEAVPPHSGWQGIRRDGSRVWLESIGSVFLWQGRPAIVSFLTDITERKRLEAQFHQAQKMEAVGHLAGGVAHDFNNLLTVINGYGEILLQTLDAWDPNRKLIDEMRRAGERAASLTRQLLVLSRRQTVVHRVLNPNCVVQDLENLLRRMIGEDIDLAIALRATRRVLADPGQLDQILLNLAVNARDAMPQGGKLTIETQDVDLDAAYTRLRPDVAPGPYVLVAMTDSGCGMTPEVQAHIFEPFFTTKDPHRGTGLGLATVYGIVKQSGGHIGVHSEPNKGTTIKIFMPQAREESRSGTFPIGAIQLERGHETVLVVEDEEAVRTLVRHVLEGSGYHVLEANDGREALRICTSAPGPIDLLVTDVVMPEMGGQQLAEAAVGFCPGLRVLYLSGYTDEAIMRHGVLHERVNFMQKPFTASALTRKVREVLDTPHE
jgi:PAS domain S-box-containing protein